MSPPIKSVFSNTSTKLGAFNACAPPGSTSVPLPLGFINHQFVPSKEMALLIPSTKTILSVLKLLKISVSCSVTSDAFSTILFVQVFGFVYFQYSSRTVGKPDFANRSKASMRALALQPEFKTVGFLISSSASILCFDSSIKKPRPISLNNHCSQLQGLALDRHF